jgi:two-component system cell cycle sensor histidine kinase/response regulator CckA
LKIKTDNVYVDEKFARRHIGLEKGNYVMLRVSDTGHGIPIEIQEQIFDPFFTTKALGKGTGLGLATVYGIVKQHSGYLHLASTPGQGSVFSIYFPAVLGEATQNNILEAKELPRGKGKVLLVDDDDMVRALVMKTLEMLGYHVLEASDGVNALNVCENANGEFDLLLTDVIMPNMNGGELAREIQKKYPLIKILFMSGYTDDRLTLQNLLEGNVNFIEKPLSMENISSSVQKIMNNENMNTS